MQLFETDQHNIFRIYLYCFTPDTCMHTCTHTHARIHAHTHMHACMHTHTCTHACTHTHACMHAHTHMHACSVGYSVKKKLQDLDTYKVCELHTAQDKCLPPQPLEEFIRSQLVSFNQSCGRCHTCFICIIHNQSSHTYFCVIIISLEPLNPIPQY